MIVWIGVFLVVLGFAWGYGIRDLQERRAQRKACKRVEQDLHITQGAAYDACEDDEPKRATNISAIHCMDQIDALLERL